MRNFQLALGNIPRGSRKKADYIAESDFVQQANTLTWTATPNLLQMTTPPLGPQPPPRLWLICRIMHCQYGALVASRLLCSRARWNPPEVAEDRFIQPAWFSTPVSQLRSRLAKLDVQLVKGCCDLYLAPYSTPRLKTQRYSFLIECSRHLPSLSDIDFMKECIALLPDSLHPPPPRTQLTEALLRAEFGDVISDAVVTP